MVFHQYTKALKEASLKHLTFKTVFLSAIGSGKPRSKIHAWLYKNIRHRTDWSKVSLYPSPNFLSKNQLAKEGQETVATVVISALAPTLDKSLKVDQFLQFPSQLILHSSYYGSRLKERKRCYDITLSNQE